jgi:hypothetical protein
MAQWLANLILFLALLAAIWYAWETRKTRLQMIRPKLVFLTLPHHPAHMGDTISVDLFIRNVGDGTAINVSIERVQDHGFKLRFEPEHIPILQKGEQKELAMRPVQGAYQPDMTTILDDPSISLRMAARYVDVEGRPFRTSTAVGGGAKPPFIQG